MGKSHYSDLTVCRRPEVGKGHYSVTSRHTLHHVITAVFTATATHTQIYTLIFTSRCNRGRRSVVLTLPDQRNNSHDVYFTDDVLFAADIQKFISSDCNLCLSSHTHTDTRVSAARL